MLRIASVVLGLAAVAALTTQDSYARGRGGGGSRGGVSRSSGASRSPSMSRSRSYNRPSTSRPSTSRPSTRPSTSRPSTRPSTGRPTAPRTGGGHTSFKPPTQGDVGRFLNLPEGTKAGSGLQNRVGDRAAAGDRAANRQDRVGDRRDQRPDSRDQRRDNVSNNRQDRLDQRHARGDQIRDQFRHNYPRFDFWHGHPNWARWRYNRPYRWATWAALSGLWGWGGSQPIYYDYDDGGNVYYQGDTVYIDGEVASTAEEYTQSAFELAEDGRDAQPSEVTEGEWMSLGVFAVAHQDKGEPNMFLQLAVNKEGVISGGYYNESTKSTQTVQGSVDKQTQRAAWTIGDNKNTVFDTGIYNLTKDETQVLVHFGKEKTQTWFMVRMEDPEADTTKQ